VSPRCWRSSSATWGTTTTGSPTTAGTSSPGGLIGASLVGSAAPISWRIQGTRAGEDLADSVRGPLNNGGLYGERAGWHLPGYPDRSWQAGDPASDPVGPGVAWYRTSFRLELPDDQDVPITLRFGDEPSPDVRVLIFLNGWNLGQYGGDIGPQRDFALPAGILRLDGRNTLALAVVAESAGTAGPVSLAVAGNHWGGVHVHDVRSPGYERRQP
jgi:beta-galactosidase GanA